MDGLGFLAVKDERRRGNKEENAVIKEGKLTWKLIGLWLLIIVRYGVKVLSQDINLHQPCFNRENRLIVFLTPHVRNYVLMWNAIHETVC